MDEQYRYSSMQPRTENEFSNRLLLFPDTHWAVWKWIGLRGAGFPISQVLKLAMSDCAATADFFLACEEEAAQLQQQTIALISAEASAARGERWLQLLKLLRRIKEGKQLPVLPLPLSAGVKESLEALQASSNRKLQAQAKLQQQFLQATEQTMHTLREVAQDERFREAVMWQNRSVIRNGIEPFLQRPVTSRPGRDQREKGRLIAKYLQRYCTKNDTIGFFGPAGWGQWVPTGATLTVRPGPQLLNSRMVYFETWAIDALAETLAQDDSLLPWAIPRLLPFLYLSGSTLQIPFARPLQLSEAQATVLAACDGQRTAREVAQIVLCVPHPGLIQETDVFSVLAQLRRMHRIAWAFEVSMETWHPEQELRQQLERITPELLRQRALHGLTQLETARNAIAAAAGNVGQLAQAMNHLETTFTALTGRAATREAGKTYAARTLIYEDCRRDIELTLGPLLLQELGNPLALLLTSARWFTYKAAQIYRAAFSELYRKLAQKAGASAINFAVFWSQAQPLIPSEQDQRLITSLLPEFQQRWAEILVMPTDQRHVHYTSKDLQTRVREAFSAPEAGWRSAFHHSPDVMLSATSLEAVLRGEYQLVLGELHPGRNTLDTVALATSHPFFPDLLRSMAADFSEARVVPIQSRHTAPAKRGHPALTQSKDWRLIFSADSGGVQAEQVLPIGQLILDEQAGKLVVHTRDGRAHFDLLEIFDGILSLQVCDSFKIFAPAVYTPRVTVDRLVICRETWRFTPAELPWAFSPAALDCFIGIRRWARTWHMPRYLFVRMPNERKPYYVDLDSPIYTEMFASAIRQTQIAKANNEPIVITEMLPDPEHAWLPDANGHRYTSELRIIAVDQASPLRALHYENLTHE